MTSQDDNLAPPVSSLLHDRTQSIEQRLPTEHELRVNMSSNTLAESGMDRSRSASYNKPSDLGKAIK